MIVSFGTRRTHGLALVLLAILIAAALLERFVMAEVPPARGPDAPNAINPSGVNDSVLPIVRPGSTLTLERVVVGLYDDAMRQINADLALAIEQLAESPDRRSAQFRQGRAAQLQGTFQRRLNALGQRALPGLMNAGEDGFKRGLRQARAQLNDVGLGPVVRAAGSSFSFGVQDRRIVEIAARDMLQRLQSGAGDHAARSVGLFRSLGAGPLFGRDVEVTRIIARGLTTGSPIKADRALRDLFRDPNAPERESYRRIGAKQITVGGWTGPVRTYTSTVVRTRSREATEAARHERLGENGIELVQIVGATSVNFCTRFLGLVVALGNAQGGFPSISELPSSGPPFHPNCSKSTAAYIDGVTSDRREAAHNQAIGAFRRAQSSGNLMKPLAA